MEVAKEEIDFKNSCVQNENVDQGETKNQEQTVLSKRQLKLLEKRKRWLELKPLRRAKEKEKRKLKIQRAKESGVSLGPSRKMLKASKMSDSSCKLKICFDLSLSDLMTTFELSKTLKQLHRCYSINRRAHAPLQLYITGYNEKTKCAMSKTSSCFNWDVNFDDRIFSQVFDKSDIIYLTSDSPNVVETLDHTKVYIIGALVDHNRLKNVCFKKAIEEGVKHARLPLDTYFKFKTRTVLTIDQVYSIILRITEGKSWIDAVSDVVPKRKGIELKDNIKSDAEYTELDEVLVSDLSKQKLNTTECDETVIQDDTEDNLRDQNINELPITVTSSVNSISTEIQ